ncbi:MAG: hypothetical protein AAF961_12660, partial [Planctomycetota bacterium]
MTRLRQWLLAAGTSLIALGVVATKSRVHGADVYRYPNLRLAIRSWHPSDPVQTHRRHSSGSCSHGGAVGLGVGGKNGFRVDVRCLPGNERIIAEVAIEPAKSNTST